MKCLLSAFTLFAGCACAFAQEELVGKSAAEVISIKGNPISKTEMGTNAIYRWKDAEVGLVNGFVTSSTPIAAKQDIGTHREPQIITAAERTDRKRNRDALERSKIEAQKAETSLIEEQKAAAALAALTGKTAAELIALKGKPVSKSELGSNAIYRWKDAEVNLVNGVVTSVIKRNLNREEMIRRHNSARNAEEADKIRVTRERVRKETEMDVARSEAGRIENERANVAKKSTEQIDYKKRYADGKREAERADNIAREHSLRDETNRLSDAARNAYSKGDKNTYHTLAPILENKRAELEAVRNKSPYTR